MAHHHGALEVVSSCHLPREQTCVDAVAIGEENLNSGTEPHPHVHGHQSRHLLYSDHEGGADPRPYGACDAGGGEGRCSSLRLQEQVRQQDSLFFS